MAQRGEKQAAQLLGEWLEQDPNHTNDELDAALYDYVLSELAGVDVHVQYPELRHYILTHPHASQLYMELLEIEQASMHQELPQKGRRFVPDLSFLAPPNLWESTFERATGWAEDLNQRLKLRLPDIQAVAQRAKQKLNQTAGEWQWLPSGSNTSPAYGFGSGDISDEMRWLGAIYVVATQHAQSPSAPIKTLAAVAAKQAGLPAKHHKAFAQACANWLRQS